MLPGSALPAGSPFIPRSLKDLPRRLSPALTPSEGDGSRPLAHGRAQQWSATARAGISFREHSIEPSAGLLADKRTKA
jgi:hypothetical protein